MFGNDGSAVLVDGLGILLYFGELVGLGLIVHGSDAIRLVGGSFEFISIVQGHRFSPVLLNPKCNLLPAEVRPSSIASISESVPVGAQRRKTIACLR